MIVSRSLDRFELFSRLQASLVCMRQNTLSKGTKVFSWLRVQFPPSVVNISCHDQFVCQGRGQFSDKNMKHLPKLLTTWPCFACRIPLLESTVNENTSTAVSAQKYLHQIYDIAKRCECKLCLYGGGGGGLGGTPYNGQYGEAPPERGTFFLKGGIRKGKDFTS